MIVIVYIHCAMLLFIMAIVCLPQWRHLHTVVMHRKQLSTRMLQVLYTNITGESLFHHLASHFYIIHFIFSWVRFIGHCDIHRVSADPSHISYAGGYFTPETYEITCFHVRIFSCYRQLYYYKTMYLRSESISFSSWVLRYLLRCATVLADVHICG